MPEEKLNKHFQIRITETDHSLWIKLPRAVRVKITETIRLLLQNSLRDSK